MSGKKKAPDATKERILQPREFSQGKIGSGYMATVAGQPAIRDTSDRETEDSEDG